MQQDPSKEKRWALYQNNVNKGRKENAIHQIRIYVIQAFGAVWFVLVGLPSPAVQLANILNQLYPGIRR